MYTEIFLGREVLKENELNEKEKIICFDDTSLFCEEKSVKYSEFYQAMSTGMKPEKIISMNKYEYYLFMKESIRKYCKVKHSITGILIDYTIIREFEIDNDSIELTLIRGIENVSS